MEDRSTWAGRPSRRRSAPLSLAVAFVECQRDRPEDRMPTYEYRCRDCGQHHEVVQSFTDDALTECPACGGELRKVFSPIGISFKGSGFYRTDSRTGAKASADGGKPKSSTSESSTSDSSASKATAESSKSESGAKAGASDAKSA
jgi:putative FmdB family regulatory protein